eukprot:CAMPEP_0182471304 /NCGR_PEP_ID=MMETSP1319-20130603/20101_1 /TAXON_ID=172717 /ORGANISM="Bolidomonas pacifica, Strain RCC208" /LENGTH=190 /DNA_ID=CAMNT_0024671845 /DNA_START=299 /DNA_END=868 /DNA_ORIENTATION=+
MKFQANNRVYMGLLLLIAPQYISSFAPYSPPQSCKTPIDVVGLYAAKKKRSSSSGGGGFGFGKSTAAPPATSPSSWPCADLHSALVYPSNDDDDEPRLAASYSSFGPPDIVRSRFAAYAKKNVPYIIKTTSASNPQHYNPDYGEWKKRLEEDCYDSFDMVGCDVLSTTWEEGRRYAEGEEVTVTFIARMR